jgi:hypothetical protein
MALLLAALLVPASAVAPAGTSAVAAPTSAVAAPAMVAGGWERLGGVAAGAPAVTTWGSGRLDVFVRGTDNEVWHKWYDGRWSWWEPLGGVTLDDPAVVSWGAGRLDLFVRGTDNQLWHKWYDGRWSGWEPLGGGLTSAPSIASWAAGRLDVFVRGRDNQLWHKWFDGRWSGWETLGGALTSAPGATSWGAGRIDVVVRGTDGAAWHTFFAGGWHGFDRLGGVLAHGAAIASWSPGRLDVLVDGTDGDLYDQWYVGTWSGWQRVAPGPITSTPAAVSRAPGRLDVVARGADAAVYHVVVTEDASGGGGSGSAPSSPPVTVCGNASLLSGPSTMPAGAVDVPAGDNYNQLALNSNLSPNTTYYLEPGVHTLEAGQYNQIQPQAGDTFIGAPGAILDGANSNEYAFTGTASNVTIEYLTIRNFVTPFNEGAVNHDGGTAWTISRDTITNIGNTAGGGTTGAAVEGGSNEAVTYSCLSYDGQYGLNGATAAGPDTMLIDHDEFSHDAPNGDPVGGTSGAFKLWYDTDVTITNNWVHDSGTVGMWADTNNNGVVIEGNYVDHSQDEGLIYEISYNALIENNTFVDNAWTGASNAGFPTTAVYVFSSGGDARVKNNLNITTLTISGNDFIDNYGGVVLYQNGDRVCGFSDPGNCTLVDPSTYTEAACQADITERSPVDYYDNCTWKTQNVTVTGNTFAYHPASIPSCTFANTCGFNGLFGTWSGISGRTGPEIPLEVSERQHNVFADNTYQGALGFTGFNQGDNVTWPQWHGGFTDSSGDQFSGQDAGSRYS